MVMLNLENVLSPVIVDWKTGSQGRDTSLHGLLFGHEGRTWGRLGNLYPRQPRFLEKKQRKKDDENEILMFAPIAAFSLCVCVWVSEREKVCVWERE